MKQSVEEMLAKPALNPEIQYTQGFVAQFFHEVTPGEADEMLPYVDHRDLADRAGYHFYRCDFFNEDARICMAHNARPALCSGFPWYGKKPDGANIGGYLRCSYWEDVPEGERPPGVPVEITPRPIVTIGKRGYA